MTTAGTLSCGTGIVLTEGEPEKTHNPPHEATARNSYYLVIRRRESSHLHGARVDLAMARNRGDLHLHPTDP